MSDIEDQGSFRASRSIPGGDVEAGAANLPAHLVASFRAWFQPQTPPTLTPKLAGYEAEGRMNHDRSLT